MKKNTKIIVICIISLIFLGLLFSISRFVNHKSDVQEEITKEQSVVTEQQIAIYKPYDHEKSKKTILEKAGIAENTEGIAITLPEAETFALAGNSEAPFSEWLQKLPAVDRDRNLYLIIPSEGLIIPVSKNEKGSADYEKYIHGEAIDFNAYLENGAHIVPGTSKNYFGEPGNIVISGHSSYFVDAPGRYKTHFQKIIPLEKDDELWIVDRVNNKKYSYKVTESYNTDDEDMSILGPTSNSQLTLFTCTPIGGIAGRWVVKSEFVGKTP